MLMIIIITITFVINIIVTIAVLIDKPRFDFKYQKTSCSVSSDIQTPRSGLKNEAQPSFLRPTSRCLDIG